MTGQEPEPTQTNNDPPPEPTEPAQPSEPQQTFDADYVKDLRAEAAKHRKTAREAQKQLDDLQKAQDAAEAKKLEEQGEWQKRAEQEAAKRQELEQRLEAQSQALINERRTRLAVHVATRLGAIDPTDANFTAAVSGVDIEADDAEAAIQQRLEALRESRPYLFQGHRPPASLASFNPAHGPQQPPQETDEQRRNRIYGNGRGIFDVTEAGQHGGGVVFRDSSKSTTE